jgi:hypothetical protein
MPSGIKKSVPTRRSRRENPRANWPQPVAPVRITAASVSGPTLTLTFDQRVFLDGLPGFGVDVIADAMSAVQTAPNVIQITFSVAITGATSVNVGYRDPAVRSYSGGYVIADTHVFA